MRKIIIAGVVLMLLGCHLPMVRTLPAEERSRTLNTTSKEMAVYATVDAFQRFKFTAMADEKNEVVYASGNVEGTPVQCYAFLQQKNPKSRVTVTLRATAVNTRGETVEVADKLFYQLILDRMEKSGYLHRSI